MLGGDLRDILGGAALILIGVFAAAYSLTSLKLGIVSQMGPGMFPAALGIILTCLGVAILVPAMFRAGEAPDFDFRPFCLVGVSLFAFAMTVRPFGLVPAIILQILIATRADSKLSLPGAAALAVGQSLVAMLIFKVGLGLHFAAFNWPW